MFFLERVGMFLPTFFSTSLELVLDAFIDVCFHIYLYCREDKLKVMLEEKETLMGVSRYNKNTNT